MVESALIRRKELENQFPVWPRRTLGSHFAERCEKFADRPLLLTSDRQYTYAEVWEESVRTAKALLALGVKRRDHVALLMDNKPEFISLKIAIALVGAVCAPLNTMLRANELEYMLRQSDTRWIFLHETIKNTPYAEIVSHVIEKDKVRDISGKSQLQKAICIPNQHPLHCAASYVRWDDFLSSASSISDEEINKRMHNCEYPDEVADIIYTSGTTGLPKGVMLTHDMILRCAFSTALSRAFEDGRRMFTTLPMYHVFAYVEGLLSVSFAGGAIVFTTESNPREMLKLMEQTRASDFLCVPSMLISVLHHPGLKEYDLTSLFSLMCSAAPAPVPVWEQAVRELGLTEICTAYGGTEATAASVHTEVGDPIEVITTRVGRIKPGGSSGLPEFRGGNTEYKVVDSFTRKDLEPDAIGELVVRGNIVTHGYYNKPEETAAVIDKDGWFHTGDLGRIDENGYIEFLGRSKDLYKVSGENVAPKEVEEVISRHEAVKQVYVVGVADTLMGEIGAAFVELKSEMTLQRRDIVQWCRQHLARFKIPRHVWFVQEDEWPLTGNGKLQKFRLREMAMEKLGKNTLGNKEAN